MTAPACALCGAAAARLVLESGGYRLLRCDRCGLVRTAGDLTASYDENYYSAHTLSDSVSEVDQRGLAGLRARVMRDAYAVYLDPGGSRLKRLLFLPLRNRLGGLPPSGATGRDLLDVGSGDGDFLYRARAHGWNAVGQEVNPAAVASARAHGLTVHLGELDSISLAQQRFDVIRLWHVLEHVTDPIQLLRTVRGLLRHDGIVIAGVPDFDSPARRLFGARWSGLQLPHHRQHFNRRTLRATLEKAGFRVVRLRHRSVGTAFSSLPASGRASAFRNPIGWGLFLLGDDVLDLVRAGDSLEVLAKPVRS